MHKADRRFRITALAVTILAIGVFGVTLLRAVAIAPADADGGVPAPQLPNASAATPDDEPSRLIIPSLSINADVQQVGVNKKGNMGTPSNFSDVAWYRYGTPPGFRGSAVIAGHVDNGLALAGVFKHLIDLKGGDDVYIETKSGTRLHFVVIDVQSYPYADVPLHQLFERDDTARLNLITCGGSWIKQEKTYDKRLVVYTMLVP